MTGLREEDDSEHFAGLLLVGHRGRARDVVRRGRRRRQERERAAPRRRVDHFAAPARRLVRLHHPHRLVGVVEHRPRRRRASAAEREADPRLPDEALPLSRDTGRRLGAALLVARERVVDDHHRLVVVRSEVHRVETAPAGRPPVRAGLPARVVRPAADAVQHLLLVLARLVA